LLKFKAIECYHSLHSSVAKADNNFCYFRGESECDSFLTPNKTDIKSINGTFAKCPKIKITPKLQKLIHLSITVDSYATEAQILLKKLLKIFNNPKNFDLKFNTEDKHIYVHTCKNKARDNSIRCELEACNRIDCIECDWISYYESYVRWDVGRRVLYKKFVQEVVQWKRCKSSKWDTSTIREGRVLRRISVEVIQMQRFQEFN
jgi:hypothetical protein